MMYGKTRQLLQLLLVFGLGISLTLSSCSDNDLVGGNGDNNGDDTAQVDQIDKHDALACLLGALAEVDSLPDNWKSPNYTVEPTVGVVKDAAEPHVRYLVVPDAAEAYRTFCSYIGASSTGEATNQKWSVDSIGTLQFEVNNQADLYATLKVSVQQLPTLEELRFVPSTALGDNGFTPTGDYYKFGDVVKQTKDGKETYYVCVRPCSYESKLRKTHWATLQLADENFKEINSKMILPTKLCTQQAEGARMVQNFFNLLRIIDNPSIYENASGIDKISKNEFPLTRANYLHQLWTLEKNVWNLLRPSQYEGDLRALVCNVNKLSAFYHGYSSVWWPCKGDYRVYQLDLSTTSTGGLFNKATTSTPWMNKRKDTDGYTTNFKNVQNISTINGVYIDSYKTDAFENSFLVKTQTGAELMGKSGIDPDPANSFVGQKTADGIEIEDVLLLRNYIYHPYYTVGDEVEGSVSYAGKQICFLSNYKAGWAQSISYFLCTNKEALIDGVGHLGVSSQLAKLILYQFYQAYCYAVNHGDCTLKSKEGKALLTENEQAAYNSMLSNLYNNYLKGRILVNSGEKSITANLEGVYWKLTVSENGYEIKRVSDTSGETGDTGSGSDSGSDSDSRLDVDDPDDLSSPSRLFVTASNPLKPLYVIGYSETNALAEQFSDDNHCISLGLKGIEARNHLKEAVSEDLHNKFGSF